MASTITPPSAPAHQKPSLPRFTTVPSADRHSRESSPSSCDTPNGSRSSSRRRTSFGSIKEDVDGMYNGEDEREEKMG